MYVLYVRARKETGSAKGNQERESTSAKKLVARKRGSAKAKARNLRPKKERKSASAKVFRRERESASAKTKKKRVPSSGVYIWAVLSDSGKKR